MNIDDAHFDIERIDLLYTGMSASHVRFENYYIPDPKQCDGTIRSAHGRAVVIDSSAVELKIYPFYELIHRSWRPGTHNFIREDPSINLGTSVRQFVNDGGPELKNLPVPGIQRERVPYEVFRCIFACNTLQTGFIRGNGFIIAPPAPGLDDSPTLICKPPQAPGRFDHKFIPLDGKYEIMVIEPDPRFMELDIQNGLCPNIAGIKLAFCSPVIIRNGEYCYDKIQYQPNPVDANDATTGRGTVGNEVNWDPNVTGTSFTAFGCKDNKLIIVSMFQQAPGRNCGILVGEMAHLLKKHFQVSDAVIGGGSADTQQFIRGDIPEETLVAGARVKGTAEHPAPEVIGDRGLGAIFAVLKRG